MRRAPSAWAAERFEAALPLVGSGRGDRFEAAGSFPTPTYPHLYYLYRLYHLYTTPIHTYNTYQHLYHLYQLYTTPITPTHTYTNLYKPIHTYPLLPYLLLQHELLLPLG